jgi:hypothetical protein
MPVTEIDIQFDFRVDTPPGRDPDSHSSTLRACHQSLWSKALPDGNEFRLSAETRGVYLHHASRLGEFKLSSDALVPTFSRARELEEIISGISKSATEHFVRMSYTIGGMMIFPSNQVDGKMTINAQRGCHPRIRDRVDLTVECIRRHYRGGDSPLALTLERYSRFFQLFGSFTGFIEFFLLDDLIESDGTVRTFLPFEGFDASPLPPTLDSYLLYRKNAIHFIESRGDRIGTWAQLERGAKGLAESQPRFK